MPTAYRPAFEALEDRTTPANISVSAATLNTATDVRLTYRASGVTAFDVGVYRSADPTFGADDVCITAAQVTPRRTNGAQTATIPLGGEIPIDPNRPYVLAVADPANVIAETSETDNTGQFRKLAMAVITHGLQLDGQLPPWLGQLSAGLTAAGFDRVVVTDWAAASGRLLPGQAEQAGLRMAAEVRRQANSLGTLSTDVVDVQFIGHSRGGVVISQALQNLQSNPGPRELRLGYLQMTLLDPHPARNRDTLAAGYAELDNGTGLSRIGGLSFDHTNSEAKGNVKLVLLFQSIAIDPLVVVPANVDRVQLFYQRLAWNQTTPGGFERQYRINLRGERPGDLVNQSGRAIEAVYVPDTATGAAVGHTELQAWYVANLGTYVPRG